MTLRVSYLMAPALQNCRDKCPPFGDSGSALSLSPQLLHLQRFT